MTDNKITPSTIRAVAMNLLAMREHSSKELTLKLSKKFDCSEWIVNVLEKLKTDGLQSDERFTEAYINMRLRQGKGALVIRLELKEKGIANTLINEYFPTQKDWNLLALKVYQKKFNNNPVSDIKEKSRRIRFLAARGFSAADIQYVLKNIEIDAD